MNDDHINMRHRPEIRLHQSAATSQPAIAVAKAPRGRPRKDALGREADQQALVAAAIDIMREAGAPGLTARAVAARAGTAIGSVYAAFPNLEALRLEVNTVTMSLLRDSLATELARSMGQSLRERLLGLADAYMSFADTHPTVWAALFEPRTMAVPLAMAEQTAALFALLEGVLSEAGFAAADVRTFGRALWAAVHGTVFLARHGNLGPIAGDEATALVHALVTAIVRGLPQ